MKNEGWTICDLAGELWARGIDIDDISDWELSRVVGHACPELAAADLCGEWPPLELQRYNGD